MSFLEDMYKAIILEHYKTPRNKGHLEHPTVTQSGHNPTCGDQLELELMVEDGLIKDVRFDGRGCAISQASASLMTQAIKGKPVTEALEIGSKFQAMIRGEEPDASLGDLTALQGVSKLHARVKCATLAWQTLEVAGETLQKGN
jgi:nitrogen fixation protein NifU and related proteins